MITATDASAVEAMMPKAGTFRLDRLPKRLGKRPSFAAASGISAQIMVQPLSAPIPETMTARATRLPAQAPPPTIELAAVEYEALLASMASWSVGTMPKTAIIDRR